MRKLFINIFCLIFIFSVQLFSQQFSTGSPEWLIDMFFIKSNFPDKANYFSGEMIKEADQKTLGEEINGKGKVSFHNLFASNDKIVFTVQIKLDESDVTFYCYLKLENNIWKINAVRRFLLPAFIYSVRDSLSQLKSLSANDSAFYRSLDLFTSSDDGLKEYLNKNLNLFKQLILSFNNNNKEQADKILSLLGCNAIYTDQIYTGCTFIQILKFEDMEAGFINITDDAILPIISPKNFVYIEEVTRGWYIYRMM